MRPTIPSKGVNVSSSPTRDPGQSKGRSRCLDAPGGSCPPAVTWPARGCPEARRPGLWTWSACNQSPGKVMTPFGDSVSLAHLRAVFSTSLSDQPFPPLMKAYCVQASAQERGTSDLWDLKDALFGT